MLTLALDKRKWYTFRMLRFDELWEQLRSVPLYMQLRRLRWMLFPGVMALASIHQLALYALLRPVPTQWQWLLELLLYSATGSFAAWIGVSWIADAIEERDSSTQQLNSAFSQLEDQNQQLLTLHTLGRKISAAKTEYEIITLAAQAPLHLAEAKASTILTFNDEKKLNLDMAWGLSEPYIQALRARLENGNLDTRCHNCTGLEASITSDCPLFSDLQPVAQSEGIGALSCIPIIQNSQRTGIIAAYFPQTQGPTENQRRVLSLLADMVSTSLKKLELQADTPNTSLDIMAPIFQKSPTTDQFIERVLRITLQGWNAQVGGIYLFDEVTQTWHCPAYIGDDLPSSSPHYELGLKLAQQSYKLNRPVIHERLPQAPHRLRSAAATPLIVDGQSLGALFLASSHRYAITSYHSDLITTFAHQIALALRSAEHYLQLSQTAVLQERLRLSREFHDGLAQTLGYLNMQSERILNLVSSKENEAALREISHQSEIILSAYTDVREAIDGLRFNIEKPGQLANRLSTYSSEFSRQTGLHVKFEASPEDLVASPDIALQILRIAQEALTNVRKHAQAKNVQISISDSDDFLTLCVDDDGRGFPTEDKTNNIYQSHGLTSMRERAEELGGTLTIATGPKQGSRITASIPQPKTL
ncbi:MAG: GAF domain-containing protein [Chloroflexi bacterium]|nr:GAF domain-containing protein [Chloroflexota bacterium]